MNVSSGRENSLGWYHLLEVPACDLVFGGGGLNHSEDTEGISKLCLGLRWLGKSDAQMQLWLLVRGRISFLNVLFFSPVLDVPAWLVFTELTVESSISFLCLWIENLFYMSRRENLFGAALKRSPPPPIASLECQQCPRKNMGTCTYSRANLLVLDFRVSGNVWSGTQHRLKKNNKECNTAPWETGQNKIYFIVCLRK